MRNVAVLAILCIPASLTAIRLAESDDNADGDALMVAESHHSEEESTAVVVKPHNYWMAESAVQRCKEARKGRLVRRIIGGAVGLLFAVPVALIFGGLVTPALYWTWYLEGQTAVMFVSTVGAGAFSAWATVASAVGGVKVATWTTDIVARLFGLDGHKPACCCLDDSEDGRCAIVGNKIGSKATCPAGWVHDAVACKMPEPEETFSGDTISGCECQNVKTCETNKFHRGHAWCTVKSGNGCKPQARTWAFKHWDYCMIVPSELGTDGNETANSNLAQFVPNLDKGRFRLNPQNVWRFGSWVDTSKGLVIARVKPEGKSSKQSSCFAGDLEETLDGCAMRCIQEGAEFADEQGDSNRTLECHAFAYSRMKRICVRLPEGATGAEFKPFQRNPRLEGDSPRDGWQNFKRVFS